MAIESIERTTAAPPDLVRSAARDARLKGAAAPRRGTVATSALVGLSLALLIVELWLATRNYEGVVRDARFYMVQALRELDPARFADDLYFRFGSQDRFTIFTALYAPVVARLGVGAGGLACTLAGQGLWLGGLACAATGAIRRRRWALLAIAAAIILPSTYTQFGYGEEFASPRLFAEGLSLAALGLLVRRRTWWALAVLALSAAVHPLTTLPAAAFALLYLALGQRWWWAAIVAGAGAVIGLSLAGIEPFAGLRATYDPAWFDIVRVRDPQCLVTAWTADAYFRVLSTTALTLLSLALAPSRERRFLGVALAVGLGGVACTLVGGDLARNLLIVQLQPWRAMWLATVIAQLYAVPTLLRLRRRGIRFDLATMMFAAALGSAILSQFAGPIVFAEAPLMLATAALAAWQLATGRQVLAPVRGFCLFAVATVCAMSLLFCVVFLALMREWPAAFERIAGSLALVTASAAIMACWLHRPGRPRRSGVALLTVATALLSVAALTNWDQRTPWTRFVESSEPAPESLAALLPQNASVYWEGGLELLWLKLRRPSYFSCGQGTGVVFFRDTAMEFRRRAAGVWPVRPIDFDQSVACPHLDEVARPVRTRADLHQACTLAPELDYLVLARPVEGVGATMWQAPVAFQDFRLVAGKFDITDASRFYVYSCAALSRMPAEKPAWHFRILASLAAAGQPPWLRAER